jgi:hypothetical protein
MTTAIDSPDALRRWLAARGIATSHWNSGPAKGVDDLWREVAAGESVLLDNPPRRSVEVVMIWARDEAGRLLIEDEQEMADGRRRKRERPPSEKLKPGEDYANGARRGLAEELGLAPEAVTLLPDTYRRREQTLDSPSYPGLPTCYTLHEVDAVIRGLPSGDFSRDNTAPADPVRRHWWTWKTE